FFFFSSRRRHTRFSRDWSSDVCSSDLVPVPEHAGATRTVRLTLRFFQYQRGKSFHAEFPGRFALRQRAALRVLSQAPVHTVFARRTVVSAFAVERERSAGQRPGSIDADHSDHLSTAEHPDQPRYGKLRL